MSTTYGVGNGGDGGILDRRLACVPCSKGLGIEGGVPLEQIGRHVSRLEFERRSDVEMVCGQRISVRKT